MIDYENEMFLPVAVHESVSLPLEGRKCAKALPALALASNHVAFGLVPVK